MAGYVASLAPFNRTPDQTIANDYIPGHDISARIDSKPCFGPVIASFGLSSPREIIVGKPVTPPTSLLEPRSFLILTKDARHLRTHEILARTSDVMEGVKQTRGRPTSLTFRTGTGEGVVRSEMTTSGFYLW